MSLDIPGEELKSECPLDGKCSWKFKFNSAFNSYGLPVYECGSCGLQSVHPKKNIDYDTLYGKEYYSGEADFSYKDERKTEKFDSYVWDARLRNIKKYKKSGNFLDVGSSFGGFLNRAKIEGFNPYGIEISKYSSGHANQSGIPTFQGNFLDSNYPENFFDVITLIEVIEHLEQPKEVFRKLSSILKKDGLLVLQTADFEGLQARKAGPNYHYYLPGHLYYYSLSNLKSILSKNGFSRFIPYFGVDFPLSAKLLKSRGNFKNLKDYLKWFTISLYHFKSKIRIKDTRLTSSLVLYAFK
ncbi:MAG: class I SAM-dependent methyltransferase [Leptospira sp.]|nr:class I SAM-dependent methyltransferase [Leptospira sp.]